jgi:5-methyltetrahydrofolate--homocysteine methyltransferase
MANVYDWLDAGNLLVGDGAMGTMLQEAGLTDGGAPELWNLEKPEIVAGILNEYAAAGANYLTTNSFGGTRGRLAMHGLEDKVFEVNEAAAKIARAVADNHKDVFVFGDIGPSGELMEPMGILTHDDAVEIFAEQIKGLVAGGVDAILIETMSDLEEVRAAVAAAHREAPGLPVVATLSFDTNLRTMMGVKPAMAVNAIAEMGVRLIGANCGRGTDEMQIIATEMLEARPAGIYLLVASNAGLPQLVGGEFVYTGTPEEMANFATQMRTNGINAIGACCGSTPAHIAAIRNAVAS